MENFPGALKYDDKHWANNCHFSKDKMLVEQKLLHAKKL